jgi:hypothetical protein
MILHFTQHAIPLSISFPTQYRHAGTEEMKQIPCRVWCQGSREWMEEVSGLRTVVSPCPTGAITVAMAWSCGDEMRYHISSWHSAWHWNNIQSVLLLLLSRQVNYNMAWEGLKQTWEQSSVANTACHGSQHLTSAWVIEGLCKLLGVLQVRGAYF